MSTIVRTPSGSIKLFCKGADTVVLECLAKAQPYTEKTLIHLKVRSFSLPVSPMSVTLTQLTRDYATEGLRTLRIAYRDIPEAEYRQWASIYEQAAATISFGFRVRVPILVSPSCTNEHPSLWTKYTVAGECKPSSMNEHLTNTFSSVIPGSFVFTMLFLPLYAVVAPAIGFSTEYYGLVPRLWTDAVFYFVLILVPIVCLTRDFIWK
jgi:magnesium-transporting ATPase (P-type)